MKTLPLLFLCLIPFLGVSQKTKSVDVARLQYSSIVSYIRYDKNNSAIDTTYTLYGQDNQYTRYSRSFVIKSGTIAEIYILLRKSKTFLKAEDPGTSTDIDGVHVSVSSVMGGKYIALWDPEKGASGYTDFNGPQITKLMDAILYHCQKNKLKIIIPKEDQ